MNILIPDSWLREHLETKATPKQIAGYLSLCSQSVEKTTKVGDDWVYEIEITTNRPDCLSVYGIARELTAILPRFGINARLQAININNKPSLFLRNKAPVVKNPLPLEVKITQPSLCPRFTAIIFDNITVKPSPKIVQKRLTRSGIRALNSVVDISNYLMLELGQPMHTFDYDKIREAKMLLRESEQGEKIVTLDGVTRKLPQGAIVIEDGEGRTIDLCGIMGGENSAVDKNTKRVLLFVQTYDPIKIRQTCQGLGFRTEASSRFEKSVDPEGVFPAMQKAITSFEKNCQAKPASKLIDIYPHPPEQKSITLTQEKLNQVMGVKINLAEAKEILEALGFITRLKSQDLKLTAKVPHWRNGDVAIPEDLAEEIARIYGYQNLPSRLPTGDFPQPIPGKTFYWEEKVKDALKNWGFTEVYTYSMHSKKLIEKTGLDLEKCLQISNPLTKELEYMRTSLIPSLLQIIALNQDNFDRIKVFELANIYLKSPKLPEEKPILIGAITGKDKFLEIKGVVETLLEELGMNECLLEPLSGPHAHDFPLWHQARTALISKNGELLGILGEVHSQILENFGIANPVAIFNLDMALLARFATSEKKYQPPPKYPPIIEDLAFVVPPQTPVGEIIQYIKQQNPLIQYIKLLDSFDQTRTFRIVYQHPERNLTDKEVREIRKRIIQSLGRKFALKLKESS